MNTIVIRNLSTVLAVGFLALCLNSALAQREPSESSSPSRGAWQPAQQDRTAYRDIVDLNIFLADRQGLAAKVDRERNPPAVKGPEPVATETEEVEETPPNPDTLWRLTGIGRDRDGATAFIEHMETGELSKVTKPMDFSVGEITTIGYDAIIYVVEGEGRMIRVGESLVGQPALPAAAATPAAGDATGATTETTTGATTGGSAADRLRLLRERREREQGSAP